MSDIAKPLSQADIDSFVKRGYIVLHDCFSRETAESMTDAVYVRLGYDKNDPSTWVEGRIHMPVINKFDVKDFAPKAWHAMCQLLGGEERVDAPCYWNDAFIVNFHDGSDQPWRKPSAECPRWHKDGDFFRHFLDSPEQGLLTLVIWSDIKHQGGGTYIAPDSVGVIAKHMAEHPEGIIPTDFPKGYWIEECNEFIEFTGVIGDVVLLHPYMLHTVSQNMLGIPRIITNPPIGLKEPMQFNREDPADFSPVELAVLHGLGVERYDFKPTNPRESVVPARVLRQQKMIEEEKARLAAASPM